MNNSNSRFSTYRLKQFIVILIVALIGVAVVWPTAISVLRRMDARNVQSQAKNIELSLRLLVADSHGFGMNVFDATRDSGLSETAEQEVLKLSGATGQLYILSWDQQNMVVNHFLYFEGDYYVNVVRSAAGSYNWATYRLESKLK